jgi:hypothetical protein
MKICRDVGDEAGGREEHKYETRMDKVMEFIKKTPPFFHSKPTLMKL